MPPAATRHAPPRSKPRNLYVRCQGVNEYVVVPTNALPENVYDLIHLLRLETAPRSCWLDVAAAYFRAEKWRAGITVLEEATSEDVENILAGAGDDAAGAASSSASRPGPPPCSRLDLLAALSGAYVMMAGASAHNPASRADALSKAADVLSRADKIDLDDPAIWAARGWADLHAGKPSASNWLENARERRALGAIGLAALQLSRPAKKSLDSQQQQQQQHQQPHQQQQHQQQQSGARHRDGPVALLIEALRSDICPPGVWTGLAYALYREGRFRDTRNVARRALAALRRSPPAERLEALYLLALVETADRQTGSVEDMTLALREAYTKCGGNHDARILALIANLYFNGGDFGAAERFARRAVSAASRLPPASVGNMFAHIHHSSQIDSLFQLARAQHHLGKLDDAMAAFEQIKKLAESPESSNIKLNPGVLLRLGLLKLSTGRKEHEALAKDCLEKVLSGCNDRCGVAKRALGVLLGRDVLLNLRRGRPRGGEQYDRAVSLLTKGLDENAEAKKDIPAQLVYASLVEETYPKRAAAAYRKVIETLEEAEEEIDPEIWNNYSSILARTGDVHEAHKVSHTMIDEEYAADCMTIVYNRGRIAEMLGQDSEAEKLFKKIPKGAPNHNEGLIRLAIMLMKTPDGYAEAEKLLQEARESSSTRATAVVFMSKLYSIQQKYKLAQDALESGTSESDYVTLAFASFMHRFLNGLDEERRNRFLVRHIGSHLQQLLTKNPHNACAANGVGVYFAENKQYNEAREAFSTAGSGPNPEMVTRVNLANVQILIGRRDLRESAKHTGRPSQHVRTAARSLFEQADKLFSDAISLTKMQLIGGGMNNYCELLLYSAWAQFESEDYRSSARTLGRLVHLMPHSFMSWFNLALALMESAVKRIMRGSTRLEEISTTKRELEGAKAAMYKFKVWKYYPEDALTKTNVRSHVAKDVDRFIWMEIKSQDVLLRNARMKEEDLVAQQEAQLREMEKYKEMQRAKQLRKLDEQRRKEEELRRAFAESERKRLENEEKHQRALAAKKEEMYEDDEMVDGDGAPPAKKSKKKRKQPKLEDQEMSGGEDYEAERKSKKRRRKSSEPKPSPEKGGRKKPDENDSGSEYSDAGGDDGGMDDDDRPVKSSPKTENGTRDSDGDADANGGSENGGDGLNGDDASVKPRKRMKVDDEEESE